MHVYYLNIFLFFSVLGYFFETAIFALLHLHNHSGFMYLLWTPFYGTGVIITILIHKLIEKFNLTKKKKYILLFIIYFITFTCLEELGGLCLEYLHGYYLWDYDIVPLHMGKYVSVPTSILWATFALIYLNFIKDYTDKIIKRVPKYITYFFTILFIVDLLATLIRLLDIKGM